MDEHNKISCAENTLGVWPVAIRGAELGLVGVLLEGALVALALWVWFDTTPMVSETEYAGMFLTLAPIVYMLIAGAPTIAGGVVSALILRRLMCRRRITSQDTVLVGALCGICWGLVTFLLMALFGRESPLDKSFWLGRGSLEVVSLVIGINLPIGIWHSWRMVRFLQKHGCGDTAAISQKHENSTSVAHR